MTEYALGNDTPQYTLQTPGVEADGINLDADGNLYVAYRKGDGRRAGGIEYFAQGVGPGKDLDIRLTAGIALPRQQRSRRYSRNGDEPTSPAVA